MPRPDAGLRATLAKRSVVAMPDVFLDVLASLPAWDRTRVPWDAILQRGGGNLPVEPISLKVGGNAANTALGLAALGVPTHLVARTNPFVLERLREDAARTGLDLGLVQSGAAFSATLALEFDGANLMLSHAGPLLNFGPGQVGTAAWKRIESSDAVLVTNWSQNRRGTELLAAVARRASNAGARVYVDLADPRHRGKAAAPKLKAQPLWRHVWALSVNENEARWLSGRDRGSLANAAQALRDSLGCRVDLHTRAWAASYDAEGSTRAVALRARARRVTGAGDAWNAGNIVGDLLAFPSRRRLGLAHRVATRYVGSTAARHPGAAEVGL